MFIFKLKDFFFWKDKVMMKEHKKKKKKKKKNEKKKCTTLFCFNNDNTFIFVEKASRTAGTDSWKRYGLFEFILCLMDKSTSK